jgi:hypothetical protein
MDQIKVSRRLIFFSGVALITLGCSLPAAAQVQTTTSETTGLTTSTTTVRRGDVVYVSGNDLVVKLDTGEVRHFVVPDSTTFIVDGKTLTVHDLQPGMHLKRTVVTSTTPKTITTVKTVTGTVWHVTPPLSVILTLEDGSNKSFKIPKGQKFMVDGKETDAFGLKEGMKISATAVTEVPETVVAEEVRRTGRMPPPPTPPPADQTMLVADEPAPPPPPAPAPAPEPAPTKLPTTATNIPLLGLLGLLSVFSSLGLKLLRRV